MTQRFRATLAYVGTAYAGFQRQAGDTPTIQGALEKALRRVAGLPVTVIGAGRTDAGVHASGQVVAFDLDWRHPPDALLRALNANLPTDIALQTIARAEPGFHPRFSARSRTYTYRFYQRRVRQPLWDAAAWQIPYELDAQAMNRAAASLVGEHDFATFGQPPQRRASASTIRVVTCSLFDWGAPGEICCYTITANAFLQRMVRSIMGTLVEVGRGAMECETFAAAFAAANRSQAGPSAPPHGLSLVAVEY
ncbi:MAG: tRNA pseudouridine(38-40) synthase TruA [Anaerolineae bacterium]|nr:tRNA pseudouridine(38-40) synthase TruA [Anaerolineae bacterium]